MSLTQSIVQARKSLFKALKDAQVEVDLKRVRNLGSNGIHSTAHIGITRIKVILDDIHEDLLEDSLVGIVKKVAYIETPIDIQNGDKFTLVDDGITHTVRKVLPIEFGSTTLTQEVYIE